MELLSLRYRKRIAREKKKNGWVIDEMVKGILRRNQNENKNKGLDPKE